MSRGATWSGAVEVRVRLEASGPVGGSADGPADGSARGPAGLLAGSPSGVAPSPAVLPPRTEVRALAYPQLVGDPAVGDRVLLNVSALARGLGTGGYALVVAGPPLAEPHRELLRTRPRGTAREDCSGSPGDHPTTLAASGTAPGH